MSADNDRRGPVPPQDNWWSETLLFVLFIVILGIMGYSVLTVIRLLAAFVPQLNGLGWLSGTLSLSSIQPSMNGLLAAAGPGQASESTLLYDEIYRFGFVTGCVYAGVIALALSGILVLVAFWLGRRSGRN